MEKELNELKFERNELKPLPVVESTLSSFFKGSPDSTTDKKPEDGKKPEPQEVGEDAVKDAVEDRIKKDPTIVSIA